MHNLTLALLVCTLLYIPVEAQDAPQTSSTKAAAQSKRRSKTKSEAHYSCPMHPTVKSKSKGRCPKCGMDLRLVRQDKVASQDAATTEATETGPTSKMNIPDTELLDQDGRKRHFYTDLVKARRSRSISFLQPALRFVRRSAQPSHACRKSWATRWVETCILFPSASIQRPTLLNDSRPGARNLRRAPAGLSLLEINRRLTNCYGPSARLRRAAKITRRRYSSATTHTAVGRVLTVWQKRASWSRSSTTQSQGRLQLIKWRHRNEPSNF